MRSELWLSAPFLHHLSQRGSAFPVPLPWPMTQGRCSALIPTAVLGAHCVPLGETHTHTLIYSSHCHINHIPPSWWAMGAGLAALAPARAMGRMWPLAGEGSPWLPSTCSGSGSHSAGAGWWQDLPSAKTFPHGPRLPFPLPVVRGSPEADSTAKLCLYRRIPEVFSCF